MQNYSLAFPSIDDLWEFKQICTYSHFVESDKCMLTGEFPEDDVATAIQYFNASIIKPTTWCRVGKWKHLFTKSLN